MSSTRGTLEGDDPGFAHVEHSPRVPVLLPAKSEGTHDATANLYPFVNCEISVAKAAEEQVYSTGGCKREKSIETSRFNTTWRGSCREKLTRRRAAEPRRLLSVYGATSSV